MAQNSGKKFESQIKTSIGDTAYLLRIPDPPQSFKQSADTKFSHDNPYDFALYSFPIFFALELKTTEHTSLSFWKDGFPEKTESGNKRTYMLRKNQVIGLREVAKHKGVIAGFIINFSSVNHTYFINIIDFLLFCSITNKKSINEQDIIDYKGYLIPQRLLRTNYHYSMDTFMNDMKEKYINKLKTKQIEKTEN